MSAGTFSSQWREIKAFNRKPAHDILIISQQHQSLFSFHTKNLAQAAVAFKFYPFGQGIRIEGLQGNGVGPRVAHPVSRTQGYCLRDLSG